MAGFIKVDRAIFETDIMSYPLAFRLYMLIKKEVVYKSEGVMMNGTHVMPGQWLRSYRKLRDDLSYKEKNGMKAPGLASIKRAVEYLLRNGLVSFCETHNGTLFTVVETQENQAIRQAEDNLSERSSERHRNTHGTRLKKEERRIKHAQSYSDDFEEFWSIYPKKVSKKRAYALWQTRLKEAEPDELIQCAENYAAYCKEQETPTRYIKHPTTFLSDKQDYLDWLDYEVEKQTTKKSKSEYWQEKFQREDEFDRKRKDAMTREIKINEFVMAGLNPMFHGEVLEGWLSRGGRKSELEELARQLQA